MQIHQKKASRKIDRATLLKSGGLVAVLSALGVAKADADVVACCDPGDLGFGYAYNAGGFRKVTLSRHTRATKLRRLSRLATPGVVPHNVIMCAVPAGATAPQPPDMTGVLTWWLVAVIPNAGGQGGIQVVNPHAPIPKQTSPNTTPNRKNNQGNTQEIDVYVYVG